METFGGLLGGLVGGVCGLVVVGVGVVGGVVVAVGLSLVCGDAAVYCARVGWSAGAAVLLGRAKRAKKTYDFDDL